MRHLFKPIICVLFVLSSLISIKHFVEQNQIFERIREGQEMLEQINNDVEVIKNFAEESGMISDAKKDFSTFASRMSFFFGHTELGKKIHSAGFDTIRGLKSYVDTIFKKIIGQTKVTDKNAVWFSNDRSAISNMLNARILKDGYAVDMVYEPNDKYAKEFKEIRKEADKNRCGLWAYDEYRELVGEGK